MPSENGLSRRKALGLLGAGAATPLLGTDIAAAAAPAFVLTPGAAGAPPVAGLHLTFGSDPARQMIVSWITDSPVRNPRVLFGGLDTGFGACAQARTRTYVDGASNRTVYVHHARLERLRPDTSYVYAAQHDGAGPDAGTFRTAPGGRAAFTFTSFGDQSTPHATWNAEGAPALTIAGAPAAADIVAGIERVAPLFHLLNGDLCYANLELDRIRTWNGFFQNNARSARFRPWMPAAGNHEVEKLNGPIGFNAFQTYFTVPDGDTDSELNGLWYAFTAGSVRVIVLQNEDNCFQDGAEYYLHGFSGGRQQAFLERELRAARASRDIDWIVVAMHQVMMSSADASGGDMGLRQAYGPLFDQYGVDLVVCGHEHHYERTLAVRGVVSGSETLTPNPASTATDVVDTSQGTVHMVLGGGGVSRPTNHLFFPQGKAKVITGVGEPGPNGKRPSKYAFESAVWSAKRDAEHPYGFAAFTVDPGRRPGDLTRMHVTYYNVNKPYGELSVFEQFTLQRPRADG
ncbi:3',5'-cyclic AMP phosphodiesterase CpdA [Amycolatopsis xylanica]|uniref:3',5'-cyclic AMP phosphodiesterase CpdA n=1 Tax=Amycolatopsis xylanica TaxID=589385 RepID=A0A1H3AUH9_9PSEU|nr:metallophosphoesterase family protein [Amycolatopsis xylanica]SDX33356.1 3',5'-cyclic AMP phosphodiesterase CpdA [Amycolatopsis xylanica]